MFTNTMQDTLTISIKPHKRDETTVFQATLQQRGAAFLFESFRPSDLIQISEVQALRRIYEQKIAELHALEAAGFAVSSQALDLQPLRELGRRIAQVLPLTVRLGISVAVQRAQERHRTLRLLFEVAPEATAFLALPWELLVLPPVPGSVVHASDDFLLLDANVTLIRQERGCGRNTLPQLAQPLTLQAFAASPLGAPPIELKSTYTAIAQVLPEALLPHCWYDGPDTLRVMQERLGTHNPQVLHILCHGEQSDTGRGIRSDLLLTHADGYTHRVSVPGLAPVLTLAPDLQLVILHACHGGTAGQKAGTPLSSAESERRATESIALELVRRGVPMVVAMQSAVGQAASSEFMCAYYQALCQGASIERAVACGRIAVWTKQRFFVDWSLPVMYQGSGMPTSTAWHTRLADSIDGAMREPTLSRGLRAAFIVLALLLFTMGVVRWLLLPPTAAPPLEQWNVPMWVWLLVGLVVPAMIAAAQHEYRDRVDLDPAMRRAARRGQWVGAYLGYVLGGATGMLLLALAWVAGLITGMPIFVLLFVAVLLGAALMSYTMSRSQARAALAFARFEPALFDGRSLILILAGMLFVIGSPWLLLTLGGPLAFLLDPGRGAVALGTVIISMVLLMRDV